MPTFPSVSRVGREPDEEQVPVLDEGQVVGVINRSDITHYSMQQYLAERGRRSGVETGALREAAALPDDEVMASSI